MKGTDTEKKGGDNACPSAFISPLRHTLYEDVGGGGGRIEVVSVVPSDGA